MTQTHFDNVRSLPIDKFAQELVDMTFLYEDTRVPKNHYKKLLNTPIIEMIENSVQVNLIGHILGTLQELKKQNPRLFYQALICLDLGIEGNAITQTQFQALNATADAFESDKKPKMLNSGMLDMFEQIEKHGVYTVNTNADKNE